MYKKLIAFIFIFAVNFTSNAIGGPFGLDMGMTLKEIGGNPKKLRHGLYEVATVPKPHSAFESYVVQVTPKNGLCFIKGIGKDISTSSYGFELQSAFNEMENNLEKIYGKHKRLDFLFPNSIWDEPNDWMMSLVKKERVLASFWSREEGSVLPQNITKIGLFANPTSPNKGYIAIEYYFKNEPSCEEELSKQENQAL